jgi:K+-transporting ATPase KdpF subunit
MAALDQAKTPEPPNVGRRLSLVAGRALRGYARFDLGPRPPREIIVVTMMYWLSGLLALFIFGYLLYALLKAERF